MCKVGRESESGLKVLVDGGGGRLVDSGSRKMGDFDGRYTFILLLFLLTSKGRSDRDHAA